MNSLTEKLIIALVVLPAVFGIFKGAKEMTVIAGAIAVALFFANLDKFSYFKGGGVEARLKEAVDEAYAALEELKDLGLALSSPIVDELALSGRMMQYMPLKYKLERVEEISQTLKKLGATDEEIREACSTIFDRIESDHIKAMLGSLKQANPEKESLFEGIHDGKFKDWAKADVERLIEGEALQTNENYSKWSESLDYFKDTRKLKYPDDWQS
tara:strand:+ start:533 stop:1174 length:642 start_codon:yes stop_codon:yes gene_type:complete